MKLFLIIIFIILIFVAPIPMLVIAVIFFLAGGEIEIGGK